MAPSPRPNRERAFDPLIFGVSATLTALFVLWSAIFPESMETVVNAVFGWTTEKWGWLYLWTVFLLVGASIVLLVTKFGTMKLGNPDDKPEFSTFAWFAMLFGSAIAAGIVFWGPAEPAYHYMSPPPYFGGEAKTAVAGANAMTYSFFHWGLSAWAIYVMLTIPLAHACFTKGLPFKFSSAFYYVLGDGVHGIWGIALGAVAAVLAATGSLRVIQTASIATAFPLMFLLLLVLYGTFKGLSEYRRAEGRA